MSAKSGQRSLDSLGARLGSAIDLPLTMARSGLLAPGLPNRIYRELAALRRWGTTLGGSLMSAAARDPDRPAIIDEQGTLTFAEVDARSSRLAAAFDTVPASPESEDGTLRVGLLCRNHRGMVESLIACSKLGASAVLLNTGMGADQLLAVLAEQRIGLLVTDAEFQPVLTGTPPSVLKVMTDSGDLTLEDLIGKTPDPQLDPPERPGRIIVLSSGTTGRPKGARRPPSPGIRPLASMLSRIPLRVHGTMLIEAPLFHTWGYAGLQLAIALRSTIVLHRRFVPETTLSAIEQHGCTSLFAIPVMLQRILDLPEEVRGRYNTSTLRIAALSGSALPGDLAVRFMDAFGDTLYNLYGSTEASWVSIATPSDLRARPNTAGLPPRGTRVAILDARGAPVAVGETGRIFAANELLFEGYTSGDTKEISDGMLSLGDVGHLDEEGRLYIDGRTDDMVVSGGENVFPREVEDVLARLPQIREVAVVGVPDKEFGQRLAAYVVLRPGEKLDADAVRAAVKRHFARWAVPRDVVFLDELPRNATGKVLHRRLAD